MAIIKTSALGLKSDATNLVLLSSAVADNNSQISFDNTVITDTYDTYFLSFRDVKSATDNVNMRLLVSEDNGSTFIGANYYSTRGYRSSNNTNNGSLLTKTGSTSTVQLTGAGENNGGVGRETIAGNVWFYNLRNSSRGKNLLMNVSYESNTGYGNINFGSYYLDDDAVVNNFKIYFSSGNVEDGRFSLYGVKD